MPSRRILLRRRWKNFSRNLRGARAVFQALLGTDHPLLAHIIPVRRCNLSCTYCNEYDDFSKPVPTEADVPPDRQAGANWAPPWSRSAAASRCCIPSWTTSSHRMRKHGIIAGLITNGYLLIAERIERLNRAGLEWLQISHR